MSDNVGGRRKLDFKNRQKTSRETAFASSEMTVCKIPDEGSVRYEGSKESSVYKSSDAFFEYSCDPCRSAGDHLEAEGFCGHCREYLCGTCFRSHSRGKATKHHKLLNKDSMPRKQVQLCDPCKTVDEELEAIGYCENCEEYVCSSCFKSHSRSNATKYHRLMDKDNMPEVAYSATASSIEKLDISKEDAKYQKTKEEYEYIQDINVKAAGDAKECYILAMTLVSDNKLVLTDFDHVKLVDVERNVIKGTLKLESKPCGLTTVSNTTVAVSLPLIYVIQIILISGNISIQRSIQLTGQCLDIQYLKGKLYASLYNPVNFQILQLSGAAYKTIKPEAEVLKHCTYPYNIAVSPNESVIYVSDYKNNKVMCVDMDGNMISMYQRELHEPMDIVISPFGSVYLCNRSRRQNAIYKMMPDLSKATVILGPGDGLQGPQAMCFNIAKQHLYISNGCSGAETRSQIKVFKWR